MNILTLNSGSSSIKFELFDMPKETVLASGMIEKISEEDGQADFKRIADGQVVDRKKFSKRFFDHEQSLNHILDWLMNQKDLNGEMISIQAIGHRVVHGGEDCKQTMIVDDNVMESIRKNIPLAPLHNPANLLGIEIAQKVFPDVPQIAVFDTAFHQTLSKKAFLYGLPLSFYENDGIRRYGFHGSSHAFVMTKAAEMFGKQASELNLISLHLGNGCSMAAIEKGRCIDTTMGVTPLEGLMMGTRCGDIDPAIIFYLAKNTDMDLKDIERVLNKESGLKGLCLENDMRKVMALCDQGNQRAQDAVEVYCYRIKKYIGAYFAALGHVDALIFTAGIGENSSDVRETCLNGLEGFGVHLDLKKNLEQGSNYREIQAQNSPTKILIIATNEELQIAREVQSVLS